MTCNRFSNDVDVQQRFVAVEIHPTTLFTFFSHFATSHMLCFTRYTLALHGSDIVEHFKNFLFRLFSTLLLLDGCKNNLSKVGRMWDMEIVRLMAESRMLPNSSKNEEEEMEIWRID